MQQLPHKVRRYCKVRGITYEWEGESYVEFRSPAGYKFANDGHGRILDIEDMPELEIVDALMLFKETV